MLKDGHRIKLGSGVVLNFRRPNPLSGPARLDLASRHRTQPPVDGILFMGGRLILGPGPQCHIVCPGWEQQLILYFQNGTLCCRSERPFSVDGTEVGSQAEIHRGARIAAESLALVLEDLTEAKDSV